MNKSRFKRPKENITRHCFNSILKFGLIGTVLVSSFAVTSCSAKSAKAEASTVQQKEYKTSATNLSTVLKDIKATCDSGQWDIKLMNKLCGSLTAIEARLNVDDKFKADTDFKSIINNTEVTLGRMEIDEGIKDYRELLEKRVKAAESVNNIKYKLGMIDAASHKMSSDMLKQTQDNITTTVEDAKSCSVDISGLTPTGRAILKQEDIARAKSLVKEGDAESVSLAKAYLEQYGLTFESVGITVPNPNAPHVNAPSTVQKSSPSSVKKAPVNSAQVDRSHKGYHRASTKLSTNSAHGTILVKHGTHTYGCATQEQYDKVLARVEQAVANKEGVEFSLGYKLLKQGKKLTDYAQGSREFRELFLAYKTLGFLHYKVGSSICDNLIRGGSISATLERPASDPCDGSPNSAYDTLFRSVGDCDAYSHVESAIFDTLGFSTMILAGNGHADCVIKAKGMWWRPGWKPINPTGVSHLTSPTF